MAAPLVHVGATILCPHAGQASVVSSNARVRVGGQPAATVSDSFPITGCPFVAPGPKPQPCTAVQWIAPAVRVRIGGRPAVLQASTGLCKSAEQIPQGSPTVVAVQPRVRGT